MNEERLEFLYNTLRERSLVDPQSNFEQFRGAYATTDRQKFLYDALRQRQLVDPNSSFTQFQSAYFTPSDEVKKKDTATQAGLAMAGGPDSETPAIPGVVGDLIRSVPYFGDFVDDIYRAGAAGLYRGASTTEVFKGAFGGELDEDDYDDILANMRTVNQYGQSDEAKQFQKEYEEADGFFDQLYVMATNPTAMGEVMVGSIAQMVATATERGGLGAMTAGAAASLPVGLAGGPLAGVTVPAAALSGAVGALSGATDATATMLEIIREELDKGGMELTKDNLQAVFQDQETVKKMRSKALSRGIPIAVMDAVTMGVAGKVVQTLGAGVKGTLAGGAVEMLGGGAGEAAAQVVSGDPLNQGDILLEAAAEGPMVVTSLITGKRPKYTVGGQKVSRQDFENYINSGEDLTKAEVKNDPKLEEQLQEQKEKSGILKDLPEDMVEADRMRAMELERERGKKAGSKLEVNKKRVSDIDTELKDIYRRYFDEGQRKTEEDKGKKTVVPNADEILANIGKVRPKTLRGLYEVNKQMFGLDEEQALANTIIMDRMIGQMAKRAGVEKQAMYGEIGFVKGDEATAQGLRENGTALFQNDFSDVETGITYRYDKNTDEWAALEEDGTITRNKTLADFEGEPMLVHGPDVAFSGSIMVGDEEVVKGQGGMYYPIKYLQDGVFWASKGVGPTNQAIASLNKSGRTSSTGNGYMVLMTGGFDKILNSFTGFGSVMNILNHVHEKGLYGVSQTRFQKALRDAYKTKFKGKAVFEKGVVAASGGTKDMVAQLVEDSRDLSFAARAAILDNFFDSLANGMNRSTVENRVAFKKFLAGDNPAFNKLAFRGRALIKKTDLFDGFSYMIGEPFLRDMKRGEKGSYAYAVLEAVRPEGMSRNADLVEYSGESKHDSYPSVIKLKEGVKFRLHALSDHSARYEDSFKHPQTGTMKTPTGANVFGGQIQMGVDVMQVTGVKPKEAGVTKGPERTVNIESQENGDMLFRTEGGTLTVSPLEDELIIDNIFVDPSVQRQGVATDLIRAVMKEYDGQRSLDQIVNDERIPGKPYTIKFGMTVSPEGKALVESVQKEVAEWNTRQQKAKDGDALFQDERGAMVREDSKAIIYSLTSPDVSTPLHEMAHVFEHYLTDAERKQIMEWAGTKEWNRDTSEAFAEGFEAWLAEGGPQENSLFNVYDSFKKWMLDIYEGITGTPLERKLNDPMRAIYAEMTGEAQAQRQQQEAGQPKKMRRFSQRVAQNVEELREDIINNPNSYYEPQKYAEIRDRLAEMTHEELVTEMKLSGLTNLSAAGGQIGVMAGIERMNRALAEGDFNTVNSVQEELAKIGTAAGQILRQFGELRTSTPDNLVRFIEAQMKKRGREMNDAQRKRITDIANRYMQAQAQYKETIRQLTFDGGLDKVQFDALEAQAEEQQNRIGSIEREIDTFSNTNIERGWGDLGSMLIQGNLLTPMSQVTNIFANAVNATLAIPRDIAAKLLELPTRAIAKAFGKETQPSGRQFSISAYLHGARQFGRGVAQSAREAYTGETSDVSEWRIQRGFAPQRSLLALLSPKGIAVQRAKRKGVEVDSPLSSNQKAKLWVQGTFGIPAEIMFRLLSLGDTPFRRYMEGIDIYQAALEAGVTRDKEKLRQFLKYPPRKALEAAQESGRALTFQQETAFSRNAQRAVNGLINYAEQQTGSKRVGDVVKFILRSNVPYIKTPANILLETLEYAFLPLAAVKGVMKSSRGDVRGATQSFAKGFLGYMVGQAATELIKQGLMSGEPEWGGDEAEKNLAYDQFPPSSINVTGLQRYLAGGDPSVQPGDVFRSYKKLGIPGVIMGAKTMIPVDELPDDKALLDDILDNVYRSTGTLNYFLDQSFIQGINNLLNVLTETNPDRVEGRVEKWVEGTMKAMIAAPLPNTLSAVHRAEREFLPDVRVTRNETPGERLYKKLRYTILDRTFGGSEIPVRINWKGLPIQQTPPGASAWQYNLLDVTKARQGEADPVSNEIYRLYEVTDEISKVVSTPSFAKSRTFNVPSLKRKDRMKLRRAGVNTSFADDLEFKKEKIAFSVEQLNQLMQVAGQQRYAEVQDLINSSKYARMSDEQRLSALDKVAAKYNGRLEDGNRPGVFADHSVLLMQFIQQLYDGRQEVQGQ